MASPNTKKPEYRKVVVKLGTNLLTAGSDRLDEAVMTALVGQMARLRQMGIDVVIVSSGAIAAGRHALQLQGSRQNMTTLQALAAVGQGHLMQEYDRLFSTHEVQVGQALLTRADLTSQRAAANARRTLTALLELRVVPIVNENDVVATEEIDATFGDNDNLSVAVANLIAADLLVLLTDQDGLYDDDPRRNPEATFIPRVPRVTDEIIRVADSTPGRRGRGGMASKVHAAAEATSWGTATVIANGHVSDVLLKVIGGEQVGTFFEPWGRRRSAARRRSLGRAFVKGKLVVDAGATSALRGGRSSLLAVGVSEVVGSFQAGDVVEVLGPDQVPIARGAVAYPSELVRRFKGLRSAQVREMLEASSGNDEVFVGDEVVHLDNLVLL